MCESSIYREQIAFRHCIRGSRSLDERLSILPSPVPCSPCKTTDRSSLNKDVAAVFIEATALIKVNFALDNGLSTGAVFASKTPLVSRLKSSKNRTLDDR